MKTCLFVIDVQNGFLSNSTLHSYKRLINLLEANIFDFTIFTRFKNIKGSPYRKFLRWNDLSTCEEIKLAPGLKKYASAIFDKTIYTAVNSETIDFIQKNNINTVYLAGIDTDCCVLKTAVDFFELNQLIFVLEYYSASNGGQKYHDAAILLLQRYINPEQIIMHPINKENLPKKLQKFPIIPSNLLIEPKQK